MYCKNCGQEIDDNADICIHCGTAVNKQSSFQGNSNTIAIIGFVFSFLIPIVGLICSIIGLVKAKDYGGKGKGFAIAGIIITVVWIISSILIYTTIIAPMLEEIINEMRFLI